MPVPPNVIFSYKASLCKYVNPESGISIEMFRDAYLFVLISAVLSSDTQLFPFLSWLVQFIPFGGVLLSLFRWNYGTIVGKGVGLVQVTVTHVSRCDRT